MSEVARQSTARTFMVGPILDADGVAVTDGVIGDLKISKNGAAPAAFDGSATLTHRHTGYYSLAATATDLNTVGTAFVTIDDTVNAMPPKELTVIEEAVYDALYAASAAGYGTAQTGDSFARLGAPAGASIAADIAAIEAQTDDIGAAGAGLTAVPWNAAWDAEVQSEVQDALVAYDPPTEAEMNARTLASAAYATASKQTDIETDTQDIQSKIGTPAGASVSADIAAIEAQTDDIGAAGAGLTAVPWNSSWDAEVQSEVDDALKALGLDHLLAASVAGSDVTDNSIIAKIVSKSATADWDSFNSTTDSLEAIRDRGDAAWITGGSEGGTGANSVTITVTDGSSGIQGVTVAVYDGASLSARGTTDADGEVEFSLDDGEYDVYLTKLNVYQQNTVPDELTVSGTTTDSYTMTLLNPTISPTTLATTSNSDFLTFHDAVEHLRDSLNGVDGTQIDRNMRRAVRFAHRDYFAHDGLKEALAPYRVEVQDSYSTGTIAFDLTGGAHERLVTLTSGTFPSWAGYGSIVIDNEHYRVSSRLSNTTLQLHADFAPTADVAAGTSYTLYKDAYLLPTDFSAAFKLYDADGWDRRYVSEEDWLRLTSESRIGDDFRFTVMFDDRTPGRYALKFYGYPTESRLLTFLYKRKRKAPILDGTETDSSVGTIAYTNGSNVITGTTTAFASKMVGSVLRIGDATNVPTGNDGDYPFLEEHVIASVTSATSLVLVTAVGLTTGSSKKYRISDPLSLDSTAQAALLKGCEMQYHLLNGSAENTKRAAVAAYEQALVHAKEQQSKHRDVGWSPVSGSRGRAGRPVIDINAPE